MKDNIFEGCDTKQDCIIKALDLAIEDKVDCASFLLRNSFDRSEISDSEITGVISGRQKVRWLGSDIFEVMDLPNNYQLNRINILKAEFDNLIKFKDTFYKIVSQSDLDMFLATTGIKVNKDVVYSVQNLRKLLFSIKGDFFMLKDDKVLYLEKTKSSERALFNL